MTEPPIIRIDGLSLYTHHGVGDAEREIGQRMTFDLELVPAACGAEASDDVAETVDYGELAELVAEIATENRFRTLERLVAVIAETALERFEAASIRVRATKPMPPIPFTVDGASVETVRRREGRGE